MNTVLVVESEVITRYCWAEMLRDSGYEVVEAEDPSEVLKRLRSYPGTLSALVVEILLSDQTAVELVNKLRERHPQLRVITASALRSCDWPADLKYDARLEKPANARQVLATVNRMVRSNLQKCRCLY